MGRSTRNDRLAAKRTFVIDAFPDSAFRHLQRDAIVCLDVMQSGTTLVTAVAQGRRALVAASVEEAERLAADLTRPLLAGTRPGSSPFEIEDSPASLASRETERPLILFSPPGTELIVNAAAAPAVLVACFRNLAATAEYVARHFRHVALLAAGHKDELSSEDVMAAARIAAALAGRGFEAGDLRSADLTRRWSGIDPALAGWGNGASGLRHRGRGDDLEFILGHVDDLPLACACRDGEVYDTAAPGPRQQGRRSLDAGAEADSPVAHSVEGVRNI